MRRLSVASLDIDAFRSAIEAEGGEFAEPKPDAGEVLRFRMGKSMGIIAKRKDGSLTIAGEAKFFFRKFNESAPIQTKLMARPARAPSPPASIVTITLPVADHQIARERLAEAKNVIVYTDGSAQMGGKGKGGYAAIIRSGFTNVEIYGAAEASTVNRMEIIAAVVALEILPAGCTVKLHTDSKYLRNGITKWIDGWKRYGWITSAREPVKNEDLWRRLDAARDNHTVTWKWVKAHVGNRMNERADELAKFARHSLTKGI